MNSPWQVLGCDNLNALGPPPTPTTMRIIDHIASFILTIVIFLLERTQR